jgi:hypothetical protein
LGVDGLCAHRGALMRAEKRAGSGRALVGRQCAGGSARRALFPHQ